MPIVLEREAAAAAPSGALPALRREPVGHACKVAADRWRPDDGAWAEVWAPRQDQSTGPPRARVLGPRVG